MELWFVIFFSLCICFLLRSLFFNSKNKKKQLPPGPSYISSNLVLISKSFWELQPILREFKSKYGPLITISFCSRPSIFFGSHSLAHQVLIQNGAVFSDRPRTLPGPSISSAAYGPNWRLLRRNLASEILHPSRVKSYSWARQSVLHTLIGRLQSEEGAAIRPITVVDHFRYAMFSLLVIMCFGDKLDEDHIKEMERVQRRLFLGLSTGRYNVLRVWPVIGKLFFGKRINELRQMYHYQESVLIPLIKARIE